MPEFFTRTKYLDRHVASRLRGKAKFMNEYCMRHFGESDKLDAPKMRELGIMFSKHTPTATIYEWICSQDTAFRNMVPVSVFDILKANRKIDDEKL